MSDLFTQIDLSRNRRATGSDSNFIVDERGGRFESPPEMLQEFGISLPEDQYATNPPPRTEPLSEEEMQAFRDAAKAKGIDFEGFLMPNKGTGRSRGNDFITSKVMAAGEKLAESMKAIDPKSRFTGFDEYQVRSIANDIMGNPAAENFSDQIGLVDFLGLGAFYGAEEGSNTAKGGYNQYREYLNRLDSGEAQPDKINLPGTGMNMDLNALSAGSDMVMGGVEAGLNALTSFPALKGTLVGAKALGKKILKGARTRKSTRPGGTKLMSGIDGEGIDDAIVAVGDLLTREIDQDELGFYSKLLEETKKLKQENWNAKDLQSTLKNIDGVKPDEMRWTGLDDFLSKNKKVTKQEVIDHLKENRIQIKEVKQGGVDVSDADLNDNYYEDAFNRFSDQQIIDLDPTDLQRDVDELLETYTVEREGTSSRFGDGNAVAYQVKNNILSGENKQFFDASPTMGDHIIYNQNFIAQRSFPYRLSDEFENALNNGATKFTTTEGETIDLSDALQTSFEKIANDNYLQSPLYRWHDPESDYYIVGNDNGYWITQGNTLYASRLESTLQGSNDFTTYDEAVIQATQTADDRGLITPNATMLDGETDVSGVPFDAPSEFKDYLPTEGGENYREFLLVNNNFKGDDDFVNLNVEINSTMQRMLALDEQAAKTSLPNINSIDRGSVSQADNIVSQEFSALQSERKKVFDELQPLLRRRERLLGAEKNKYPVEKAKQMENFNKSHFKEDNVIANILIDDRKTIDGKKVLYIHELQSDWGQKGGGRQNTLEHRQGFATEENLSLKEMGNKKTGRAADDFFIEYKRITGFPIEDYPEFQEMILNDARTRRNNRPITFPSKVWMSATDAERANLDPKDHFTRHQNTYDIDYQGLGDTDDVIPEGRLLKQTPERGLETNPFPDQKLTKFFRDYIDGIAEKDMTIIPKGPLVENTDQWTQMSMRRMIRYATENGYDYVAWTPGDVVSKRWDKPGLGEYYNKVIPKNSKEVLKKLDKKAKVEVIELPSVMFGMNGKQKTLAIPITDTIRSSAPKGQPLFTPIAATALGGGLAAQSMNQEQQ